MASMLSGPGSRRWKRRLQGKVQAAFLFFGFLVMATLCLWKDFSVPDVRNSRKLLQANTEATVRIDSTSSEIDDIIADNITDDEPLFPDDIFSLDQRLKGAIVLHMIGMVYMFIALAIVCDEFFVPSLDVIIEKLDISEDVAGATFMAAGGSAPELFTSMIGVFISFDDVGIGTIVGSAVFNILFVIAMCVLFSKTVLELTWWPIFRDCTFYSTALVLLVVFFMDNAVYWWEAVIMFSIYILYCSFMKINGNVERFVKKTFTKNKVTRVCSTDQLVPVALGSTPTPGTTDTHQAAAQTLHPVAPAPMPRGRRPSVPVLHSGTKFRQGLLQLMIHTIDPLHDGKVDEKATQLHAIASLKVLLDATKPQNGRVETYQPEGLTPTEGRPDALSHVSGRSSQTTEVTHADSGMSSDVISQGGPQTNGDIQPDNNLAPVNVSYGTASIRKINKSTADAENTTALPPMPEQDTESLALGTLTTDILDEAEIPKPVNLKWPDTTMKRIIYLVIAPIIFPLWITLPDTRTPRGKRFFPITFLGSILWIAFFSYLMVWWSSVVGTTFEIRSEIMGLTILAAGTSVPDLITSVIVARKGFGDMAVSSSIGSNLFDVCCGLPVPWLLFALVQLIKNFYRGDEDPWHVEPIKVSSTGMACSIMLLFTMLMFVLISIVCSKWKMNKGLGITMFFLYIGFVVVSLAFEDGYITCLI